MRVTILTWFPHKANRSNFVSYTQQTFLKNQISQEKMHVVFLNSYSVSFACTTLFLTGFRKLLDVKTWIFTTLKISASVYQAFLDWDKKYYWGPARDTQNIEKVVYRLLMKSINVLAVWERQYILLPLLGSMPVFAACVISREFLKRLGRASPLQNLTRNYASSKDRHAPQKRKEYVLSTSTMEISVVSFSLSELSDFCSL